MILGWAVWYQTSGQYEHVPSSIIGMKLADARDQLESSGLEVRTAKAVYDDRVHKGGVAKSDPPAGARIAKGEPVTLTPSKGITPIEVPDVRGKTLPEATQALEDKGFKVGRTSNSPSQTVAKDRVIGTDPDAGEKRSPTTRSPSSSPAACRCPTSSARTATPPPTSCARWAWTSPSRRGRWTARSRTR